MLDWQRIYFALQQMKNERSWWNMELSVEMLQNLMLDNDWYELYIEEADLQFKDFGRDVARWEDITIALLRAYIDRSYKRAKGKWEAQYMETVYIDENDPNFFDEYIVEVRNDRKEWIERLNELSEEIRNGRYKDDCQIYGRFIEALNFKQHLYYPLFCLRDKNANNQRELIDQDTGEPLIKVSPVALNVGETTFVKELRKYYEANRDGLLKGKEVYLLRNESRKGIGFFEASNFYPDFILWVNDGKKQHITFLDPKGIRNLKGFENPKIQLYRILKEEVEPRLNDADIILDSFILSVTPYKEINWEAKREDFDYNHVLFTTEEGYIDILFKKILETK